MLQKMFRGGTKRDENRFKNSTPSNEYDVNSTSLIVHRLNASWRIGCNAALFRKKKKKKKLEMDCLKISAISVIIFNTAE